MFSTGHIRLWWKKAKNSRVIGVQIHEFSTLRFWRRSRCKNQIRAIYHRSRVKNSTKLSQKFDLTSKLKLQNTVLLWNKTTPSRWFGQKGSYSGILVAFFYQKIINWIWKRVPEKHCKCKSHIWNSSNFVDFLTQIERTRKLRVTM